MERRKFIYNLSAAAIAANSKIGSELNEPFPLYRQEITFAGKLPLKVKPVLILCSHLDRIEAETWREWGGLHTEAMWTMERERFRRNFDVCFCCRYYLSKFFPLERINSDESALKVVKPPAMYY